MTAPLDPLLLSGAMAATPTGGDPADRLRGKSPLEVAREFEAVLVAQMIAAMRRSVSESGLLSASPERRMLDGIFDQEVARSLVEQMDLGLARQLAEQIERQSAAQAQGPQGATGGTPALGPIARSAQESSAAWEIPGLEDAALPLRGPITSEFGLRADPFTGEERFHAGIDVAAAAGTPIRSALPGDVVFSGPRGRAGNVVAIRHDDGSVATYAHADSVLVAEGGRVAAGEVVATAGSTGRSTGPHLHLALERDGRPVDPRVLLGAPQVAGGAGAESAEKSEVSQKIAGAAQVFAEPGELPIEADDSSEAGRRRPTSGA